jgi:hypothetical protein
MAIGWWRSSWGWKVWDCPCPGETILVLAAIYAATEPSFNVGVVIAVAAFGAIVGDNAGLSNKHGFCCAAFGRDWHKADLAKVLPGCPLSARGGHAAAAGGGSLGRN